MCPGNVSQELQRIARDFRRLSSRFQDYVRRSRKVSPLDVNVYASAVQAGRLLVAAIDGRAFPKSSRQENGEWRDRREGRVPEDVLGIISKQPTRLLELLRKASGLTPDQLRGLTRRAS